MYLQDQENEKMPMSNPNVPWGSIEIIYGKGKGGRA